MPQGLQTADHIIIVGYFVLLMIIGVYFWRRMKHVRDFFTGGNAIPWWLAGVSFYLTGFSAFTFVAYSEMAYRFGWSPSLWRGVRGGNGYRNYFLPGAAGWHYQPGRIFRSPYSKHIGQFSPGREFRLRYRDGLKIYARAYLFPSGLLRFKQAYRSGVGCCFIRLWAACGQSWSRISCSLLFSP